MILIYFPQNKIWFFFDSTTVCWWWVREDSETEKPENLQILRLPGGLSGFSVFWTTWATSLFKVTHGSSVHADTISLVILSFTYQGGSLLSVEKVSLELLGGNSKWRHRMDSSLDTLFARTPAISVSGSASSEKVNNLEIIDHNFSSCHNCPC